MCTQRRLRSVWSESSLCTRWIAKDTRFLHADSEDSDQTGQMPRLFCVFAGRILILLVLSWGDSNVMVKWSFFIKKLWDNNKDWIFVYYKYLLPIKSFWMFIYFQYKWTLLKHKTINYMNHGFCLFLKESKCYVPFIKLSIWKMCFFQNVKYKSFSQKGIDLWQKKGTLIVNCIFI